ncbi:MAG: hypothetical protein KF800_01265 [Lysobacter sp.]|nr:hypothetical protein [Lysobacter sp.]
MTSSDPVASLIARLLAERWLPRDDHAVRQMLVDAGPRAELDRRLAESGLRLLEHPYAAHVALGIAKAQETDVFGGGRAWAASNLQLDRDAMALLVVIWAQLILPKRQRQLDRQENDRAQDQSQMFAELKPVPVGAEIVEPLSERTLIADFGDKLGGKTRISFNLGILARHGFIFRRRERIHEGPLLDLAFDYERIAGRIMGGALAFVVDRARESVMHARDAEDMYVTDDVALDDTVPEERVSEESVQDEGMHDATVADDAAGEDR